MKCPRAIIFDLDNTLSESFQLPEPHVVSRLHGLLDKMPVAIMSGASFGRMNDHLLPSFPKDIDKTNLYLFTDTAAQCYRWKNNEWHTTYKFAFAEGEYEKIMAAFEEGIKETGIIKDAPRWGELFLARDVQVTFAGLGVDAPKEEKAAWDPRGEKRRKLKDFLDTRLPEFDVRVSGRTAIDVNKTGVDKAHGVRWFAQELGVTPSEMLFVGDAFYPGGNDAVVIPTGIQTIQVEGPHQVADVIDGVLAACGAVE